MIITPETQLNILYQRISLTIEKNNWMKFRIIHYETSAIIQLFGFFFCSKKFIKLQICIMAFFPPAVFYLKLSSNGEKPNKLS